LFWGSTVLGLNLLTRITTALDILGAGCFLLLATLFARYDVSSDGNKRLELAQKITLMYGNMSISSAVRTYLRTAIPVYGVFFLVDRAYQFIRFGSWTDTYVAVLAREQRQMNPALPFSFPFDGHWFQGGIDSGLLGPLFAPEKTIFLFDPMFPLALLLTTLLWKQLSSGTKAFLVASFMLLAAYLVLYGRYDSWAGDYAWGDRYISSAVELVALLAVPLLLRYRQSLSQPVWFLGLIITISSVFIQWASLAFWLPLEIGQMQTFGRHTWVVFLRFKNIAALLLDRKVVWGLNTPSTYQDPWDAVHLTTWNFLPSLLRHVGAAPLWVVWVLYAVWFTVTLALLAASARLVHILSRTSVDGS
jgi:hypothetical protein